MAEQVVTVALIVIILSNFDISNELAIPNMETNTNVHHTFHDDNMHGDNINLNLQHNLVDLNINMDNDKESEQPERSNDVDISQLKDNTFAKRHSAINNSKLNPDIMLAGKGNKQILNVNISEGNENNFNELKHSKSEADDFKSNHKRKDINDKISKRIKRYSGSDDGDIIVWDYCEGKTHLEFIDGKFECVEMTIGTRSNFGTLSNNCGSNERKVIFRGIVVSCVRRKKHG